MGEIADMMLEGDLCAGCGVYLEGDGDGFPRYCSGCQRDWNKPHPDTKVPCPTCGKRVKSIGLKDHQRDAHKSSESTP